jgi:hypothetical protein
MATGALLLSERWDGAYVHEGRDVAPQIHESRQELLSGQFSTRRYSMKGVGGPWRTFDM